MRNINNESSGIVFYAASFASCLFSPLIKQGDRTKEFQQKAIQLHGTFHGLRITNLNNTDELKKIPTQVLGW